MVQTYGLKPKSANLSMPLRQNQQELKPYQHDKVSFIETQSRLQKANFISRHSH